MKPLKIVIFILSVALVSGSFGILGNETGAFYHRGDRQKAVEKTQGKVAILSPADGTVTNEKVITIEMKLIDKGKRGDHIHLYKNGKFVKTIYKSRYVLGLKKGENVITIRLASKDHKELGPSYSIKVIRK